MRFDTGTITYTANLNLGGEDVIDDTSVTVSLNQLYSGLQAQLGGLTLAPGAAGIPAGYEMAQAAIADMNWDQQSWSDNFVSEGFGTTAAADGTLFFFAQEISNTSDGNTVRTWAAANTTPEAGTETIASASHGSYKSYLSISDIQSNLSANLPAGGNSYPTDLLAAAVPGSSYLMRSFDSGSFNTSDTSAIVYVAADEIPIVNSRSHSDYSGIDGYLYYRNTTITTGDRNNAANPTEDRETWVIDYKRLGNYDGSRDEDHTNSGSLVQRSTTVSVVSHRQGTMPGQQLRLHRLLPPTGRRPPGRWPLSPENHQRRTSCHL